MDSQRLVDAWDAMLDSGKLWVLFENGTCVILPDQFSSAPASRAIELIAQYGLFTPGTPSADFDIIVPDNVEGWIITSQHPDIITYVAPGESPDERSPAVGVYGRDKRVQDAIEQRVIHVHQKSS